MPIAMLTETIIRTGVPQAPEKMIFKRRDTYTIRIERHHTHMNVEIMGLKKILKGEQEPKMQCY